MTKGLPEERAQRFLCGSQRDSEKSFFKWKIQEKGRGFTWRRAAVVGADAKCQEKALLEVLR